MNQQLPNPPFETVRERYDRLFSAATTEQQYFEVLRLLAWFKRNVLDITEIDGEAIYIEAKQIEQQDGDA